MAPCIDDAQTNVSGVAQSCADASEPYHDRDSAAPESRDCA